MHECAADVGRWQRLLADADARKQRLLRLQEQYRQVEDLYLTFAKKASAFNSWFENAEEDLTDPVRCNSVEEILVSPSPPSPVVLTQVFYVHVLS